MIEVKFLGRGGQGVVIAAELLARACFEEGWYSQSFSIYGGERRGAPVAAFVRIDREKIFLKCDIEEPDHLVLFDRSLLDQKRDGEWVKPRGSVLLNGRGKGSSEPLKDARVEVIDAREISRKYGLGSIVNTAMLGAYIRMTKVATLDALSKVIRENIPAGVDKNIAAAREAYDQIFTP